MNEYYKLGDADGSGSLSYDEFVYLYNWILGGQGHTQLPLFTRGISRLCECFDTTQKHNVPYPNPFPSRNG
jgi:hypothetical protein